MLWTVPNSMISINERSASRSLDEELELYELLDLDVPGEDIDRN